MLRHLYMLMFEGRFIARGAHVRNHPLTMKNLIENRPQLGPQDVCLRPCLAQTTCWARPEARYLHAQHRFNPAYSLYASGQKLWFRLTSIFAFNSLSFTALVHGKIDLKTCASDHATRRQPVGLDQKRDISTRSIASILYSP